MTSARSTFRRSPPSKHSPHSQLTTPKPLIHSAPRTDHSSQATDHLHLPAMELSAPRAATALPPEPPSPPSGYIRPPEHRIHQLRLEMKSGLAQPRNKHEQFYIELHKYNVLAGRYGHLPTMLQPPRPAFKALPSTESLPPIEFPTFSDVQPRSAPQRPSILPASGPLSSTVFAIAAKAAQLLRIQGWIEELDDDMVNEVFAYFHPLLKS